MTREDEDMTAATATPDTGTDAPPVRGALSRLIQQTNDEGISYGRMSERTTAGDCIRLSKPYLQRLVTNPPVSPPSPDQMKALAVALRVSLRQVKAAAAEQWLEYEATELAGYGDEVRIIVGHLAGMPESELRRWRAMIEADERARHQNG